MADDPQDPRDAVNLGDQVNQDAARVTDAARQVVDEVEGGVIALHLAGDNGLSACLVRPGSQAGVIHAKHGLDVVRGVQGLLQGSRRHTGKRLTLRGLRAVILDKRMALRVCSSPLVDVGLECALPADERGLGSHRHQFG